MTMRLLKGDTFDRLSTIHTHALVILVLLFDFCIYVTLLYHLIIVFMPALVSFKTS